MRVSSEALAKEDWSFGGLRGTGGAKGSCPWGSTGSFFSLRISSVSKGTTPLEGEQPFDLTFDLEHFLVADSLNCNYNLAII